MITKHKEVYFKTIIWHICYYLFHMGVYLATKDMDVVVYFYVNILLLAGYWHRGVEHLPQFSNLSAFQFYNQQCWEWPFTERRSTKCRSTFRETFQKLIKSLLWCQIKIHRVFSWNSSSSPNINFQNQTFQGNAIQRHIDKTYLLRNDSGKIFKILIFHNSFITFLLEGQTTPYVQ